MRDSLSAVVLRDHFDTCPQPHPRTCLDISLRLSQCLFRALPLRDFLHRADRCARSPVGIEFNLRTAPQPLRPARDL